MAFKNIIRVFADSVSDIVLISEEFKRVTIDAKNDTSKAADRAVNDVLLTADQRLVMFEDKASTSTRLDSTSEDMSMSDIFRISTADDSELVRE